MTKHKNNHRKNEELIEELYEKLSARFGREAAKEIFKILIKDFWGKRLTIPKMEYFYRRERNRKIKNLCHGGNYEEVGIRFNLSATQVRRIVHGD